MAYDIGWSTITDLEEGEDISNRFNVAFNNIQTFLNDLRDNPTPPAYVQFVPQLVDPTLTEGGFYYDGNQHSFIGKNDVVGNKLNLGSEMVERVVSTTGATIGDAIPVSTSGSVDNTNALGIVPSDAIALSTAVVIGLTTGVIDADGTTVGLVTTSGRVNGIDTVGIPENGVVYLAEGGGITGTAPVTGIITVIGYVCVPQSAPLATDGSIFVQPRSIISLPNVVAFMNQNLPTAAVTLTTVGMSVVNYDINDSGGIIMPYDIAAGSIQAPANGIYDMTIDFGTNYDDVGQNVLHLMVEIWGDDGVNPATVVGQYNKEVAKGSTSTNGSMTKTFKAYQGMTYYMTMRAPDIDFTNFVLENVSFSLKSIDIR